MRLEIEFVADDFKWHVVVKAAVATLLMPLCYTLITADVSRARRILAAAVLSVALSSVLTLPGADAPRDVLYTLAFLMSLYGFALTLVACKVLSNVGTARTTMYALWASGSAFAGVVGGNALRTALTKAR